MANVTIDSFLSFFLKEIPWMLKPQKKVTNKRPTLLAILSRAGSIPACLDASKLKDCQTFSYMNEIILEDLFSRHFIETKSNEKYPLETKLY